MLQRCSTSLFGTIAVIVALSPISVSADELYDAARARNPERVLMLLNSGADPNRRSPYDSPLHVATRFGPLEAVTALLEAGADIELPGAAGARPLHAAVLAGQTKIVSVLLERGAKVDSLDNVGRTPLMTFVSADVKEIETLQILLEAGANPNLADGAYPLHALDYAAIHGRADEAALLIAAGADVNSRDSLYGKSPLHYAIPDPCIPSSSYGNQAVVQVLIDNGADLNAKDNNGKTPLDYAKRYQPNNGALHDILNKGGAKF